jgi:hypothetical protein
MVMSAANAFHDKLHEYLEFCTRHLATIEAACSAMREPPAPPSGHHLETLLRDPLVFQINVPYDSQFVCARLLHEAAVSHFPDNERIAADSALVVLRTAVEILVNRHDGKIYRDALQVGESCLQRIDTDGDFALVAELTFRLGRLHFEPVAPDPAYGPSPDSLDMCLADRHDQQLWTYEDVPASQAEQLPERATLLSLAEDRFREAIRLGGPDQRAVFAAYLVLAKLELAAAGGDNAVLDRVVEEAFAVADEVSSTEDPIIGLRLRHQAAIRTQVGVHADDALPVLRGDFHELVRRFGLSQVVGVWVMAAPRSIPPRLRPGAYQNYRNLSNIPVVGETSRMSLQLLSGHCHPDDPSECHIFDDFPVSDARAALAQIERDNPEISPSAFARAALHWLHHQELYDFDTTQIIRGLVTDYERREEVQAFLTVRGVQQMNSAQREPTYWISAVMRLTAAVDLLLAGFPVWAQHCLAGATDDLRLVTEAGEDVVLPPLIPVLEQLIEVGWSASVRRKTAEIISSIISIAMIEIDRQWRRRGRVEQSVLDTVFELIQLPKSRGLTAHILGNATVDLTDQEWFRRLNARVGTQPGDDDSFDEALEELGVLPAFYLTRFEAKAGRNRAEIAQNLRKIYGISLASAGNCGASPALPRLATQATLDPRSLAISLQFVWVPGDGEAAGLAMLAVATGREHFAFKASIQGESSSVEYLMRTTLAPDGLGLYEFSPYGADFVSLLSRILTDPLVRNISAEAARDLANVAAEFPGLYEILREAYEEHGVKHVMIWPSKELYLLPYWLLPFGDGIVADHLLVTLIPTFQCLTRARRAPTQRGVLSVGSSDGGTRYGLPPVPSLTTTALHIARSFGADALVGRRASPASVLRQLARYEFVHISAHGDQDRAAPMFHCVYLDPADGTDGRLYAHQLLNLDLSGVRLVTLNACEGVLLRFDQFDEIVGLSSAFLRAGAGAVVGAMWQIRPEVGETFYKTLYNHLARGAGTLTAFRAAQVETRKQFPEYRDWGAFCFIGTGELHDPATKDERIGG